MNGSAVPGSKQYSIQQWRQFTLKSKGKGNKGKGNKGGNGKGGSKPAAPPEPTRSIYKANSSNGSAGKTGTTVELPNWTCQHCKFPANWPHKQKCVVCGAAVPKEHKAKLAKHLGLAPTTATSAGPGSLPARGGAGTAAEAPEEAFVGPKLGGKTLQKRLQELQAAEAVLIREGVAEQEVARLRDEQERVRGVNYMSEDDEAKL